jgi:hypothetical protein
LVVYPADKGELATLSKSNPVAREVQPLAGDERMSDKFVCGQVGPADIAYTDAWSADSELPLGSFDKSDGGSVVVENHRVVKGQRLSDGHRSSGF